MRWLHSILLTLPLFGPLTAKAQDGPLLLFAAASTRNALEDAVNAYQKSTGKDVVVSYGSSGTLARQLAAGAPADLYLSANKKWVSWLRQASPSLLIQLTPFAGNRLVLIQPGDASNSLTLNKDIISKLNSGRLAVGNVAHVPAGIYAKEAMMSLGLWASLQGHLAQTKDVRAALALVQRGEVPAGIVYQTDAAITNGVRISEIIAEETHSPILYFLGILSNNPTKLPQAHKFFDFLISVRGQSIFKNYGFQSLNVNAPHG